MKKKMIYLFLIIIGLGNLSLALGWYQYRQQESDIPMDKTLVQITPKTAPQTVTQFLKSSF